MGIAATKLEYEESPFDADFVKALLPKIDYETLLFATQQISEKCSTDLLDEVQLPQLPETLESGEAGGDVDEAVLKKLHTVMFDIHVVEGELVCPASGRRFNIKMGIPNMILHADEI